MKKGYLVLQDGQVFEGFRFGGPADAVGELVFTTGMCGYLETLTDPSYAGPGRAGALGCGHPGADPDHPGARRHERRDL